MKKYGHSLLRLLPLLALTAVLSACGKKGVSALEPMGDVGKSQLNLMILSIVIMAVVVLIVGVLFIYALVKFRKKPGQEEYIPKQVEGNMKLELLWTIVPLILLLILAVPTVAKTFSLNDASPGQAEKSDVVHVKVTAHQYWWQFEYPDYQVTTGQDLYIPTGKKIVFDLTSADVIHSFWVPALGGKHDNNPGQTTHLVLEADKEGTYSGRCAELCGSSHALMYFNVIAVSPDDFKGWISKYKQGPSGQENASASAKSGEKIFKQNCSSCHAVDAKADNGIAPNLTNFADRKNVAGVGEHTKAELKKWIKNPDSVKPGAVMPAFGNQLSDEQISQVADYLMTLSIKDNKVNLDLLKKDSGNNADKEQKTSDKKEDGNQGS